MNLYELLTIIFSTLSIILSIINFIIIRNNSRIDIIQNYYLEINGKNRELYKLVQFIECTIINTNNKENNLTYEAFLNIEIVDEYLDYYLNILNSVVIISDSLHDKIIIKKLFTTDICLIKECTFITEYIKRFNDKKIMNKRFERLYEYVEEKN